jgi:hypothetical protein
MPQLCDVAGTLPERGVSERELQRGALRRIALDPLSRRVHVRALLLGIQLTIALAGRNGGEGAGAE